MKSISELKSENENQERVLKKIDLLENELIQLTRNLVRIPSLTGYEKQAQSFVCSTLKEIGFEIKTYAKTESRPNLVAMLKPRSHKNAKPNRSKNILFIAHIDNIPPGNREDWSYDPYSAKIAKGRIYGRGVADMKSGLAAMIIAAKALKAELENRGTISIASVVDEEAESEFGMKYLSENRFIHADAAIFGEPAFPSIVTALKGGVWLKLITLGKKVGSGWPSEGVNAVMKMTKVLNELQKLDIAEGFLENPLLGKPTMALGTTVRGGDSLHTLPDRCEATVEIYTVPGQSTKVVISKIKSLLEKMQKLDKDLSVRLEILFEVSPIITKTTERIYRDLQSSIFAIFGKEAEPIGIPSIGDARFTQDLGIPTIIAYGPGEKGKGHVANESVEIENVKRVAKVYALTAMRFWKS